MIHFNDNCSSLEYSPKEIIIGVKGKILTYTVLVYHKVTKDLEVVFYTENVDDVKLNKDIINYWCRFENVLGECKEITEIFKYVYVKG